MASILMLLTQFSPRGTAPDPPHQLADAFVAQGHSVTVVVIPWQQPQHAIEVYDEHDRLRVLRVPPLEPAAFGRIGSLLVRWTLSSWRALRHAKALIGAQNFDLIYTTSPAVTTGFLIRWARRRFQTARFYLYIVDFFPFHQRAIGLIPRGPIFNIARREENALIRKFDVIGCMSPRNLDYLREHYALRADQRVELLPLSTGIEPERRIDRDAVRRQHGLPDGKVIAIFGGQITEGRGIEQIVETARLAREQLPELHVVLAGQGRLVHLVETYVADGGHNLTLLPGMPRDAYLDLAAACDIGLVVTVPVADIPTFPSKILDYLQASLPVVAAVEADTDFREFVENHGLGRVVTAGDPLSLLAEISLLANNPCMRQIMAESARKTLCQEFDVCRTVDRILRAII